MLRNGLLRYILYTCPNHATPCCNLFLIHAFILCHAWFVFDVHEFKWKIPNRKNQVQKLLKSEMFEILVFCCKLHRNLMIHENVMLQLHGKTHTKWVFSKNPHVFTFLHFFCKKKEGIAQRNNCQSWEYDGFYNTKAACTLMKKTLPAVSESTRFSAILRGIRKEKARADEGSDRCSYSAISHHEKYYVKLKKTRIFLLQLCNPQKLSQVGVLGWPNALVATIWATSWVDPAIEILVGSSLICG